MKSLQRAIAMILLTGSALFWVHGLATYFAETPVPGRDRRTGGDISPEESRAAEGYWLRYGDVEENPYWGRNGILGLKGPADHYQRYGKAEGRILAPVVEPDEPNREAELARRYWENHPDVAADPVWGVHGRLGIRGPRDHWLHRGRFQGYTWPKEIGKP